MVQGSGIGDWKESTRGAWTGVGLGRAFYVEFRSDWLEVWWDSHDAAFSGLQLVSAEKGRWWDDEEVWSSVTRASGWSELGISFGDPVPARWSTNVVVTFSSPSQEILEFLEDASAQGISVGPPRLDLGVTGELEARTQGPFRSARHSVLEHLWEMETAPKWGREPNPLRPPKMSSPSGVQNPLQAPTGEATPVEGFGGSEDKDGWLPQEESGHSEANEQATEEFGDRLRDARSVGVPVDFLAWYSPMTFYGAQFGIVIRRSGVKLLADDLHMLGVAKDLAIAVAEVFLYHHELFHHKVELRAIAMEFLTHQPVYMRYHRNVYLPLSNPLSDDLLEESLAQAAGLRGLSVPNVATKTRRPVSSAQLRMARAALRALIRQGLPGYRLGPDVEQDREFSDGLRQLDQTLLSQLDPGSRSLIASGAGIPFQHVPLRERSVVIA